MFEFDSTTIILLVGVIGMILVLGVATIIGNKDEH